MNKKLTSKLTVLTLTATIISSTLLPSLYTSASTSIETTNYKTEIVNDSVIDYTEMMNNIDYNEILNQKESRFSVSAILAIMKKIPKLLKLTDKAVDLGKFTTKINGGKALKNAKTGWTIQKDKGSNPHGGSAFKLFNKSGNREATLDKNGKVLRD